MDELISFIVFFDPDVVCSLSSLSRCLNKMGFSQKIPNRVLQRADDAEIQLYAKKIKGLYLHSEQIVFLDEVCNARASGTRTKSRALSGITPLGTAHYSGTRMTLCCGLSVNGILNGSLFQGGLDVTTFSEILCMNKFSPR